MELLTDNHYEKILDLFDSVEQEIKIISPFLSMPLAEKLVRVVSKKHINCVFVTRFYLEDMFAKANSIDAIKLMMDAGIEVYALKGLHTKLYLFDNTAAIIGSANFTTGGFASNIELSILFNEKSLINEVHAYFNNLLEQILETGEGKMTYEVLDSAKEKYDSLLSLKKSKGTRNTYMYGASLDRKTRFETTQAIVDELDKCSTENNDVVSNMFKESSNREKVINDFTAWLKLEGSGENRLNPEEKYYTNVVILNGEKVYPLNYTASKKPSSVKNGDVAYIAPLSCDKKGKNQPIIVGKGRLRAFDNGNDATLYPDWIKKYPWMEEKYPWYCLMKEHFVLDTQIENGIPLQEIWDRFGSDTYESSFGKEEPYVEVAKKHYEKCHIRLSGNAAEYIDARLEELKKKYGVIDD
ncbi:PLD-like domain-containing protein [Pseudobutyrivibrio sp. AR14]|uniref:phospholipase D family protein n=1 Tax=Pseudobutyrivibrio sp. AR14 TaxID=1520804 RepID=UPI0008892A21|nr:phospholipase D family protein [Pseudobutyrivibrio sp. AR14]SCY45773.1 PLD-like domain-containing protein [Pseudobutyrivibrio sp. AR14]